MKWVQVRTHLNAFKIDIPDSVFLSALSYRNTFLSLVETLLKWWSLGNHVSGIFKNDWEQETDGHVSAGAISTSYHLFINNGDNEGLFRAAICESGSAFPVGSQSNLIARASPFQWYPYSSLSIMFLALAEGAGQTTYDAILKDIGCADSSDTLACLRSVDFSTL